MNRPFEERRSPLGDLIKSAKSRCEAIAGDAEIAVAMIVSIDKDGKVDARLNSKEQRDPTPVERCVLREASSWNTGPSNPETKWVTVFFP